MGRARRGITRREIDYDPLPSQKAFHECPARFKGFSGPVGSGKSQALCQEAITAHRTDPVAHFLCASIFRELGRPEAAVAALGKVLYLDQDFILAHYALGSLYRRLHRPREARRHLAVAVKLLSLMNQDQVVPGSDGMTGGRLLESVRAVMEG